MLYITNVENTRENKKTSLWDKKRATDYVIVDGIEHRILTIQTNNYRLKRGTV